MVIIYYISIKHDCNYFMLDKFILMQCRNCKTMWLIMIDKYTILMSDGHIFTTDPLLNIIKIISTA